jgi:Tol biopolymer transport system component
VDPSWRGSFSYPSLSPDGKELAISLASARGANTDIWVKQLDKGPALKLTFDGTSNIYPTWTPDGHSITYEGNPTGAEDLMTKRADGSSQAVLQLHFKRDVTTSHWSHDGKWLIFRTSSTSAGGADIFAIRPGIDSQPITVAASSFAEGGPALSPDGRWLAYTSNETGRFEIFVVPFPNVTSAKWPVSVQGGTEALWSHSGRELFYRDAAGNLNSVAINPGPTFSMGATTKLFSAREFLNSVTHTDYDISPDDKRFIFVRPIGGTSQDKLIFVENWFEELKKKK